MGYTRPIATIDCETDPFMRGRIPAPFIWGFYDGGFMDKDKPFYYFTETEELVEFIRDKEFIIYAHNGGKFDYHYLLPYIDTFRHISIINGRLAKCAIGIAELRDSWNILPVPLAAWEKMKFNYSILEMDRRYNSENWVKILEYLESDCKNLFDVVMEFTNRFGLSLTQAGAAMKQWKKTSSKKIPRSDAEYYNDLRKYYYGGRCECFEMGIIDRPFEVVDINSAYPYAMLQDHPYGLEHINVTGNKARTILDNEPRSLLEPAFFSLTGNSKGALPYRDTDGSLIFPTDNEIREYHVTGWELFAAIDTGTLNSFEITEVCVFSDLTSFAPYIDRFYAEKKKAKAEGDKATTLFAKLFMNSLYGKFASNPDEYRSFLLLDAEMAAEELEYEDKIYTFSGFLGPNALMQAPLDEDEMRYYNVATSASITGFVRAYLWRAICNCQGVIYCDTDSIAASTVDVPLGTELGQWEKEGDFTRGAVAGKKLYTFRYKGSGKVKWKTASKGVRLTPRQILKVARGGTVQYNPEVPTYSVRGFTNRKTGAHEIARFIPRTIRMLEKNTAKLT